MIQRYNYQIAGLILELQVPPGFQLENFLPSFAPFFMGHSVVGTPACSIELTRDSLAEPPLEVKLLSDQLDVLGENFHFYEGLDSYYTSIKPENSEGLWWMKSNKDFSRSILYLSDKDAKNSNVLSWLVMMAFGQSCLLHKVILIHASAVLYKGKGVAFLGKSGTGKSTHSRLWLAHIDHTTLLNDDSPAIGLTQDGEVYIYGTPWSGKTACYKNIRAQLQGMVRLKQAGDNKFSIRRGLEAFICVLPSCTAIRWNKHLFNEMNTTLEAIVQRVSVAELECLPNQKAALLCRDKIIDTN